MVGATGSRTWLAAGVRLGLDAQAIAAQSNTAELAPLTWHIDLASVVDQALEASVPLLENAGLRYSVGLPDAPIYIEADAGQSRAASSDATSNVGRTAVQPA